MIDPLLHTQGPFSFAQPKIARMLVGVHLRRLAQELGLQEQGHERFGWPSFSLVGTYMLCSSAWLPAKPTHQFLSSILIDSTTYAS